MPLKSLDIEILNAAYNLLPDYIEIKKKTTYSTFSDKKKSKFIANRSIKMSDYSNYLQFKKALKSLLKEANNQIEQAEKSFEKLITQLTPVYSEGDEFGKLDGLLKFISSENGYKTEKAAFQPTLGQVTLIQFWSCEDSYSNPIMAHNQKMLEQNEEKWKDKAVIIGISVTDCEEFLEDKNKQKWDKIQHYQFTDNRNDDASYQIKSLIRKKTPILLLLDKQGIIRCRGRLTKTKLEEMLNKYIEAGDEADEIKKEKQTEKLSEGKEKGELKLLYQDQSQQLKSLFKNELTNIVKNMKKENINFNVDLIKTNKINRDGTKENNEKSKINLFYKADVDQKQLIETFLSDVWNKIPEDQRFIKKASTFDAELFKILMKEKFAEATKQFGSNMSFGSQKVKTFTFANKLGEFTLDEQLNCSAQCQLKAEDFDKWQHLLRKFVRPYEYYVEQKKFNENLTDNVKKGLALQENDQFQTIENYHKPDEMFDQVTHEPGQVLVIYYWDQWHQSCQRQMKQNTLFLKNNAQKWGDKLRFVCLSASKYSKWVESQSNTDGLRKSYEQMELYFPMEKHQAFPVKYGVSEYPHYVVVDKKGKIRAIGYVNNLEGLINQLLNEENQGGQELVQEKAYLNQEQMNQIQALLKSNQVKELLGGFNNERTFTLQLKFEEEWGKQEGSDEEVFLKYKRPYLKYFVRKPQMEKLGQFLDQVYTIISKDNFKIDELIQTTIDIPFPGQECVICKKELNDQVQQYYSPFKNEFLCCECAEFDDKTKKGLARYKYTDTLIFVNAPLTDVSVIKDIDDHKIGKNLKIGDDEEGSQEHDMRCNGCNNMKVGPRYISVSARPGKLRDGGYVDYCAGCFEILRNKDSEDAKRIVKKDAKDGMVSDSCLVRILFNLGYYDF